VAVRQISSLLYFDIIIPSILIGQVIGRWGNYFNQELYGPIVTSDRMIDFLKNFLPYMNVTSIIQPGWHQPLFL
jgi:phosphatidylglycerol:prolipoprotein diacylglycerol transferase